MRTIEINTSEYPEDVKRIKEILEEREYIVTLNECEKLWQKYSDSMEAGWMALSEDDDDVFDCISVYIIN